MKEDNESTAITQIKPITLSEANEYASIFLESGLFKDTKELAQAKVKIIAGSEMGLEPFESMSGLDIISGNITLSGNIQAAKIKSNPKYDYKIIQSDEKICEIEFYQEGERIGSSKYTFEEVSKITFWDNKSGKRKKLTEKDNWVNYPSDMLFNRCIGRGRRRYCPDVFGGIRVYDPEELNQDNEPKNITPPKPNNPTKQLEVVKQCSKCGNAIPNDNESGLCALCIGSQDVVDEQGTVVDTEPEIEEPEITGIIPTSVIEGIDKPREALEKIIEYAMQIEKLSEVKAVVISHYKAWETGEPGICNIPETNIIKMVDELTGIKMKKKEKSHKCDCGKRITEAEMEQQDGFCLKCWKGMEKEG